ncbi:uncharacterized protein LOC133803594 [Humulus lupulus]|uniref:uncharacterized protein LOC133803594 n=1 Tax=Humulus lupulus TaxID=3486 RepID=UPI002B401ED4|nr:uncharacterized protein LOC133803594 [Humulus lupulus]
MFTKKKMNSAPRENSKLVSSQRRNECIPPQGAPRYPCDISSDKPENNTTLVAQTPSCKIITYSRRIGTKSKKSAGSPSTLSTLIKEGKHKKVGIENPKQPTKHFASTTTSSKSWTYQPVENCDTSNAKEILLPIWWGSLSIDNDNFGNVGVCVVNKSTKLSSNAFHAVTLLHAQMIPRHDVWPNCFDTSPPTDDIIDLYFLSESESDNQFFGRLIDYMNDQDFGIRTAVGDTKFLLFSSRVLPHIYWRYDDKYYLWAVITGESASFPHVAEDSYKEPGQSAYSKSICSSWIGWPHNLENESLGEINSATDCRELAGQYLVKTCFASTLRSIIKKHGEITQNCNTIPSGFVTYVLEKICRAVQDFKVLDLKNLRLHHLSSLQTVINESEHINVNVEWLKNFHGKLSEAWNKMKEYEKLKLSKQSRMKEIESKEIESMELRSQIQSLKDDNERLEDDLSRARSALKRLRPNSLMDGLL